MSVFRLKRITTVSSIFQITADDATAARSAIEQGHGTQIGWDNTVSSIMILSETNEELPTEKDLKEKLGDKNDSHN